MNCVPREIDEVLTLVAVNEALFGNRVLSDVLRLR